MSPSISNFITAVMGSVRRSGQYDTHVDETQDVRISIYADQRGSMQVVISEICALFDDPGAVHVLWICDSAGRWNSVSWGGYVDSTQVILTLFDSPMSTVESDPN